jgi:hypothetical protein
LVDCDLHKKNRFDYRSGQFGVILKQPVAGQAKGKILFSTNFSSATGETE